MDMQGRSRSSNLVKWVKNNGKDENGNIRLSQTEFYNDQSRMSKQRRSGKSNASLITDREGTGVYTGPNPIGQFQQPPSKYPHTFDDKRSDMYGNIVMDTRYDNINNTKN
jgi:hypothetical protein